jgi:glycosyltransferase involved in cell wall biosynthesis
MFNHKRVCVVIPALNEDKAITQVIGDLLVIRDTQNNNIIDEIVVCDNGSTDQTSQAAKLAGARVVFEPIHGYGRACLRAISALRAPEIVLFIDSDHAFYAEQAIPLIRAIDDGFDLAIGSRALGKMESGALTKPQIFGNKLASVLIKVLWNKLVSDLGPFRAISYNALVELQMQDLTFGWTIEMQIKAIQKKLDIIEIPIDTRCRIGHSKISGTIKGTIGAGIGILGMIVKRWTQQQKNLDCTYPKDQETEDKRIHNVTLKN